MPAAAVPTIADTRCCYFANTAEFLTNDAAARLAKSLGLLPADAPAPVEKKPKGKSKRARSASPAAAYPAHALTAEKSSLPALFAAAVAVAAAAAAVSLGPALLAASAALLPAAISAAIGSALATPQAISGTACDLQMYSDRLPLITAADRVQQSHRLPHQLRNGRARPRHGRDDPCVG